MVSSPQEMQGGTEELTHQWSCLAYRLEHGSSTWCQVGDRSLVCLYSSGSSKRGAKLVVFDSEGGVVNITPLTKDTVIMPRFHAAYSHRAGARDSE